MSAIMKSADCVYCYKDKSGYWPMAEGWLCNECYSKIYWGIRNYKKIGIRNHCVEYNEKLTRKQMEDCFEALESGRKLRDEAGLTLRSSDGLLLIDEDKGLIYIGDKVWNPLDDEYISPAHYIKNIEQYYILYYSEVLSWTDNAIKSAYLMIKFKDEPLRYERIPLGKPKGFFNFGRRRNYRRRAKEYYEIMQNITGMKSAKDQTFVYKP